ncbi:MAG: hypothetical protein LBQ67_04970 [Treponema sp.]|jgi:hypothetical protein|nr:hypothetical protein [Treponema sp.]
MKKSWIFCCFFLIPGALLFSQNIPGTPRTGGEDALFVPFVSRLQGEMKNNFLRLSWIDSPSARGPVYIYRSELPFEEILPASRGRPVEVPYGAESYIDEPEGPGTLYYFVAASDEWGQKYEISIPFGNTISIQAPAPEGEADRVRPPAAAGGSFPGELPGISGLTASAEGDRVIIRFTAGEGKRPVLYRSVRPLTKTGDLLNAVIVQPGIASPFIDYPVPGIPYYYAVIPEAEITGGTLRIMPGVNATTQGAEAASGRRVGLRNPELGLRSLPLPQISLQTAAPGINAFSETPLRMDLSPEAARVLADIPSPGNKAEPLKKPRAFNQDLETPAGGEEHTLRAIVQDSFSKKKWETAIDELSRYLSLPRSSLPEARARFYLGQCYYFTGAYRESLFEFLSVQGDYPVESAEWIRSVLNLLISR